MAKDPSKTETATDKRRNKSREEGNVPKGQELGKTTVLLAGLIGLTVYIDVIASELKVIFAWFLSTAPSTVLSPSGVYTLLTDVAGRIAYMTLPVMLFIAFVAFLTQRLQVGPLWTTKVLKPKFDKVLNPLGGLKKLMINPKTVINLTKNLLQAIAIGFAPYLVLKEEINKVGPLFYATTEGIAVYILSTGAKMVIYALVPMLIIAIADTWYTRWDYEENLMMSKDEVKDERKQADGDPKVKAAQRRKMLQAMAERMMQDVPKADVVVTNPTHIAVALQYNPMVAPAPIVLAKGAEHLAQKIKEIARENGVPIRENKPLARALYKSVEIGEAIPEELFQTVAAVLAQLNKFKRPQP
ncbi:flagellar biosynthesis protein FlhB [Desulfovibrio ferrophilus]|uniref:Flagellar biosynthetic protein FlhB n=1 Tax=Desulfovibrio ferrophilus TaxID=241368 RepID=A0A2Z6AXK6_9BACT|nr:flagellar biosynthesis protein FlhB [Desulfovibrio ferrophilus]BBD07971.1 flagellar biosynthesis protein FlhB [Desulfovibrio ferrophilus]